MLVFVLARSFRLVSFNPDADPDPEPDPASFTNTGLASNIPTVNFMNSAAFELTLKVHLYSANFSL